MGRRPKQCVALVSVDRQDSLRTAIDAFESSTRGIYRSTQNDTNGGFDFDEHVRTARDELLLPFRLRRRGRYRR